MEIVARVKHRLVAGNEPAIVGERVLCRQIIVIVALEDGGSAQLKLTYFTGSTNLAGFRLDDTNECPVATGPEG